MRLRRKHNTDSTQSAPQVPALRELEECAGCGARLVQPVQWQERPGGCDVLLRCPQCPQESCWTETFATDAELERYDEVLSLGTEALARTFTRVSTLNTREWVERFSELLWQDQLLPIDF